jgi:hypothetical protein
VDTNKIRGADMQLNITPKEKKPKLVLISARIPENDYNTLVEKIKDITTLSDAVKQLIKSYIKD